LLKKSETTRRSRRAERAPTNKTQQNTISVLLRRVQVRYFIWGEGEWHGKGGILADKPNSCGNFKSSKTDFQQSSIKRV
ncbi:MAG: hypothetical protein KKE05_06120, partial [Nanoarchaeota archaeon]|nr:hypothetical protein [Nanoarchaeota archaeon]